MAGYPGYPGYGGFRPDLHGPYGGRKGNGMAQQDDLFAHRRARSDDIYDRNFDHYATGRRAPQQDSRRPPLITINRPEEDLRRSMSPLERTGRYGGFARLSASPPPRASRHRVDRFGDRFGGLGLPGGGFRDERLSMDPPGPRNPFERRTQQGRFDPYGGFEQPRNPFAPGGCRYDNLFRPDHGVGGGREFPQQEHQQREFYRGMVGEPWGLASWNKYEEARRRRGL
ncbi:hypothetical protein LTR78_000370 [Recurvomyces mirabilis]|uniref:Uncharacterized protein n=1 Tax=Recurvomyces mirabilis TaxID=574656 RepID=A0AAE0WXU5_9PEZI|nr:hypothetical protein LTR78_000370 [Recurvomyces mirabilis]KAK5162025.1 hypothetical protein LTS14_000371 [Recurvomyces mirabilis]